MHRWPRPQQLGSALPLPFPADEEEARWVPPALFCRERSLQIAARPDRHHLVGGLVEGLDEDAPQPRAHREDDVRPVVEPTLPGQGPTHPPGLAVDQQSRTLEEGREIAVVIGRVHHPGYSRPVPPGQLKDGVSARGCHERPGATACDPAHRIAHQRAHRRRTGVVPLAPARGVGVEARGLLDALQPARAAAHRPRQCVLGLQRPQQPGADARERRHGAGVAGRDRHHSGPHVACAVGHEQTWRSEHAGFRDCPGLGRRSMWRSCSRSQGNSRSTSAGLPPNSAGYGSLPGTVGCSAKSTTAPARSRTTMP